MEAAYGAAEDTVNAQGLQADAVQALTTLGYGSTEALQAVRKVEMDESTTVEDLLKGALKYLILEDLDGKKNYYHRESGRGCKN